MVSAYPISPESIRIQGVSSNNRRVVHPATVVTVDPPGVPRQVAAREPGRHLGARRRDAFGASPLVRIHHVVHWADHGPTSVGNCVALCGRHHRLVHHSDWRIDMASGVPEFHPPPWLGSPPRRNPLHIGPELI
jgi:hypothetical protein